MQLTPVGLVEIAERAEVKPDTVKKWRARDPGFPKPRWKVGGDAAWAWEDVLLWLRRTDRTPQFFRYRDAGGVVVEESIDGDDVWNAIAQFVHHPSVGADTYQAFPCEWLIESTGDRQVAQQIADEHLQRWRLRLQQWREAHPDEEMPRWLTG